MCFHLPMATAVISCDDPMKARQTYSIQAAQPTAIAGSTTVYLYLVMTVQEHVIIHQQPSLKFRF